jgi:hypothetical protein
MAAKQAPLRPIEQWFIDGLNDDILLHSPTTGVFLGARGIGEGEHPPEYFAADPAYAKGYDYWEARGQAQTINRVGELSIGVFLTDPNSPDGLGDIQAFKDLVREADVVGYAVGRGVNARLTPNPWIAETPGLIMPDPQFENNLTDIVYNAKRQLPVPFDVPLDAPVPRAIERRVFQLAVEQGGRYEPTLAVMGGDMIYCNTLQWGMAGVGGANLAEEDKQPNKLLIVAAGEHEDLARKISLLGDVAVEYFGAQSEWGALEPFEIGADPIDRLYAQSLKTGIIPGFATR